MPAAISSINQTGKDQRDQILQNPEQNTTGADGGGNQPPVQ
jgi:hypothetical protein